MREEKKSLKSLLGSKTSIAFDKTGSGVHMLKKVMGLGYQLEHMDSRTCLIKRYASLTPQ